MFPSISKVQKITDEITESGKLASDFFTSESAKFADIISKQILSIGQELNEMIKLFTEKEREFEIISKEVEDLRTQKQGFIDLKEKLDKQSAELNEREAGLLELHKVLENKRLMLEGKENELAEKKRRSAV